MEGGARRNGRNLQECSKMNRRSRFINREEIKKIWKLVFDVTVC